MFSNPMSSESVAIQGYYALINGKRVVVTGGLNKLGALATKFLPRNVAAKVAKSIARKK